jgi:hypothetical protein
MESSTVSPVSYHQMEELKTNEALYSDKEMTDAYRQLQKDCEDLKVTMQIFSNEVFVSKFFLCCFDYTLN